MALTRTWALRIDEFRGILWSDSVNYSGFTWVPFTGQIANVRDLDDPALAAFNVELSPIPTLIQRNVVLGTLIKSIAELYLVTDGPIFTQQMTGAVLRYAIKSEQSISIECGPNLAQWGTLIPPVFSTLCRYQSTAECSFALTCAKSWAACQANNQTAIFGGFRWLPNVGTKIIFKDTSGRV